MGLLQIIAGVFVLMQISSEAAEVGIKLKAECGQGPLSYLGIVQHPASDAATRKSNKKAFEKYRKERSIIFNYLQVFIEPNKPEIPGCFNLTAYNVTINKPIKHLAAEFHMTIGGNRPNYETGKLPCRDTQEGSCNCGAEDSCMYCDFCKDFKNKIDSSVVVQQDVSIEASDSSESSEEEGQCPCNIQPGVYDIKTEICTPNRDRLEEVIPAEVFTNVDSSVSFTLWTTLYVFTDKLNKPNVALADAKKNSLGGCAIIGTDLSFA